jgi:hypoxanthine phosphoribosyltransferase
MDILFERSTIQKRIAELASQIAADYQSSPPICIGILNGAVQFMMDLIAALPADLQEELQYDFVDISSYAGQAHSGQISIHKDITLDIGDGDVLVMDGIVDTGKTLQYLLPLLAAKKPRSIKVCTLLDKSAKRQCQIPIDYCGFAIEDLFIVGYGMDCDQHYRALPYIAVR